MALASRDVNARQPHFFNPTSRIAIGRTSPYMEVSSDENASPPLRKSTPPSQRLLAPTQASSAKTTPMQSSRLPLIRGQSPSTVPRVIAQETATPRTFFTNKPLPSRPVASFMNTMSPSKDGRCLLDASEKPLEISLGGSRYEYPALTPRSVSTPQHISTAGKPRKSTPSSIPRRVSATAGMVAAASEMTKVFTTNGPRDSKMSTASSTPSFVSASESKSAEVQVGGDVRAASAAAQVQRASPSPVAYEHSNGSRDPSTSMQPNRKESLRARISYGTLRPAAKGSMEKITGFTDFTKESMPPTPESSPATRSQSSFSRLRQPSSSKPSKISVQSSTPDDTPPRQRDTPSRLPMRQISAADHKTQAAAKSPSLEARSKIFPHTCDVLGRGIKRRELQRSNTNASTASNVSAISKVQQTADAMQGNPTHLTTPDTTARSVSPGSDAATPVSRMPSLSRSLRSLDENGIPKIWGEAESRFARAPPSCSPFTGPLQTIHSQAALPLASEMSSSTLVNEVPHGIAQLTAFPAPPSVTHKQEPVSTEPNTTAAMHQPTDSQDSRTETDSELRRTLSKLNGEGSPPKTKVDEQEFNHMLKSIRSKRGIPDAANVSSICAEAATAELYLQRGEQEPRTSRVTFSEPLERGSIQPEPEAPIYSPPTAQAHHEPTISKWSASTPSALGTSAGSNDLPTPTAIVPDIPPKDPNRSIGFISSNEVGRRSSGKRTTGQSLGHSSRNSSPILGQTKQPKGSVKNARAQIAERTANFARPTASAESKKTSKSPRPSAAPSVPSDESQRGRDSPKDSSAAKSSTNDQGKTPRSRSKSRLVFDKIHGILKRDKKVQHSAVPPLPTPSVPLDDLRKAAPSPVVPISRNDSRRVRTSKHLSKSPSWPQSRRESRATVASLASGAILGEGDARDSQSSDHSSSSIKSLVDRVMKKADLEIDPERKHRMLTFAMSLLESVQATVQAAISAEKAKNAAVEAEFWYSKALKGSTMMEALASGLVATSTRH